MNVRIVKMRQRVQLKNSEDAANPNSVSEMPAMEKNRYANQVRLPALRVSRVVVSWIPVFSVFLFVFPISIIPEDR